MSFGRCLNGKKCTWRHVLVNDDKATGIATGGPIKFRIVQVFNPTYYSVQVLEYYSSESKKMISNEDEIVKIKKKIEEMQKLNLECKVNIECNDICATYLKNSLLTRCKILKISDHHGERSKEVEVYLLDEGSHRIVESTRLFKLPEEFICFPPLVTQLRILNVLNIDKEDYWDSDVTYEVKKSLTSVQNFGDFAKCEVKFAIKDTIFTDNFEVQMYKDYTNVEETKFDLLCYLIKKELCIVDESIESTMKDLLKNAGIEWTENLEIQKEDPEQVEPVIQKLKINKEYLAKLKYMQCSEFFVVIDQRENEDLNSMMKRVEEFKNLVPIPNKKVGLFCLVDIDRNNSKCLRARISGIFEDVIEIFLVDEGYYAEVSHDEIYHCPSEFIELFPMQAVKCRLVGVGPKSGETWDAESSEQLKKCLIENLEKGLFNMKVINMVDDCYEVLVYHPKTNERIDELAVKKGIVAEKCINNENINYFDSLMNEMKRQEEEGETDEQTHFSKELFDYFLQSIGSCLPNNDVVDNAIPELPDEDVAGGNDGEVVELCNDDDSFYSDLSENICSNKKIPKAYGSIDEVDF